MEKNIESIVLEIEYKPSTKANFIKKRILLDNRSSIKYDPGKSSIIIKFNGKRLSIFQTHVNTMKVHVKYPFEKNIKVEETYQVKGMNLVDLVHFMKEISTNLNDMSKRVVETGEEKIIEKKIKIEKGKITGSLKDWLDDTDVKVSKDSLQVQTPDGKVFARSSAWIFTETGKWLEDLETQEVMEIARKVSEKKFRKYQEKMKEEERKKKEKQEKIIKKAKEKKSLKKKEEKEEKEEDLDEKVRFSIYKTYTKKEVDEVARKLKLKTEGKKKEIIENIINKQTKGRKVTEESFKKLKDMFKEAKKKLKG